MSKAKQPANMVRLAERVHFLLYSAQRYRYLRTVDALEEM